MIDTTTLRADLKTHLLESAGEASEVTLKDRVFPLFEALFDQLDEAEDESPIPEDLAELLLRVITDAREIASNLVAQIPADAPERATIVATLQGQVDNCDAALEGLAELGIEVDDDDDEESEG